MIAEDNQNDAIAQVDIDYLGNSTIMFYIAIVVCLQIMSNGLINKGSWNYFRFGLL